MSDVSRRVPAPASGAILPRLWNAITLRRAFYDAVAAEPRATSAAIGIVSLVALGREAETIWSIAQVESLWGLAALIIVLVALAGWLIYGAIAFALARLIAPASADFKRMLRCLAFAEAVTLLRVPASLLLQGFALPDDSLFALPLYLVLHLGLLAWDLAAIVVATRAATSAGGWRLWAIALPAFLAQQAVLAVEQAVAY